MGVPEATPTEAIPAPQLGDPRADLEAVGLAELRRITTDLCAGRAPALALAELLALAARLARGRRCVVLVTEHEARAVVGRSALPAQEIELGPGASMAWSGRAADLIRDWEGAERPFVTNDGERLVLPLPTGGVAIDEPGYAALSDRRMVDLLQLAAGLAAATVQMAARTREASERARSLEQTRHRLREQAVLLRDLAVVDDLTGLYNRRFFDTRLSYELERFHRYQHPLALVLLDVDHFKAVNDAHGHLVGDAVLQHLARLGLGAIRRVDLFARFGGEEFALLMPSTDLSGGHISAERLRRVVAETPALTQTGLVRVTVSAGVAAAEESWDGDPEGLVHAADQALYRAKAAGRDRVVVCSREEPSP